MKVCLILLMLLTGCHAKKAIIHKDKPEFQRAVIMAMWKHLQREGFTVEERKSRAKAIKEYEANIKEEEGKK